jgi:hypothetical protein
MIPKSGNRFSEKIMLKRSIQSAIWPGSGKAEPKPYQGMSLSQFSCAESAVDVRRRSLLNALGPVIA